VHLEIEPPEDFSFFETLNAHGWRRLAPFDCNDTTQTLHRAEQMPDGEVAQLTICMGEHSIHVEVDRDVDAGELHKRVRVMFQLDVPIHRFHHYCATETKLKHIPGRKQGRMLCSPSLWEDCCKVILTTNTTWNRTVGMTKRFVDTFGSASPADSDRKAFPTPQQIAVIEYEEFEAKARFGYRNQSLYALAQLITNGERDLETYRDPSIESKILWKELLGLRGVGPYAASCLMIYLGRYERVNVDSWARMMVSKELGRPVSDSEVHEFFAPYGEWSGLVYHFYPWKEDEPSY